MAHVTFVTFITFIGESPHAKWSSVNFTSSLNDAFQQAISSTLSPG
jgi:hypothetical protein